MPKDFRTKYISKELIISSIQSELRGTTSFSTAGLVKTSGHNILPCLSALKEAPNSRTLLMY